MLESIPCASGIEGVAVGDKGLSAPFADRIRKHLGVVWPQVGEVARLPEVDFNRRKAFVERQIVEPRRDGELLQLDEQVGSGAAPAGR